MKFDCMPSPPCRMQNTNRLKAWDELEQVGKQHIDHDRCKPREDRSCPLACRTFCQVVEHFQNGFHQVADSTRHEVRFCTLLQRAIGEIRNAPQAGQ